MKNQIVFAVLAISLAAANATSTNTTTTKPAPVKCGKYMAKVIITEVNTKEKPPGVYFKKPNGERAGFATTVADIKKLGYVVGKELCIDESDLE